MDRRRYYIFLLISMTVFVIDGRVRRLRTSPPFGFAQNTPDQGSFSVVQTAEYGVSTLLPFFYTDTQFLYGFTDRASAYLSLPFIWDERSGQKSHGFASLSVQGEYAFVFKEDCNFFHQMTFFARIFFPTTTAKIEHIRATKSMSYFPGVTHSILTKYYHIYGEVGYLINTKEKNNSKLGNLFTYNLGFGRFIVERKSNYLLFYGLLTGAYMQRGQGALETSTGLPTDVIFLGAGAKGQVGNWVLTAEFQYPIAQTGQTPDQKFDCRLGGSIRYFFS